MEMLSKAECPQGNIEFLSMIADKYFDRVAAERLLLEIPDIDQLVLDLNGYSTTYLFEAQTFNNVEAVRFLLEHGADPNLCHDSDCALDDLHFGCIETPEEAPKRLEIAKLFFEFGGDPNIRVDGETLYDHVIWEVFYDDIPHDREYLYSFFKLLLAYGGGGGKSNSPKPQFTEVIDRDRIAEYTLKFVPREDGYVVGHLINPDGIDIGIFE